MIIVGMIGFLELPVRWVPDITPPEISIDTSYTGASAHLIEQKITKVIEGALSGISGIKTLNSVSAQGESRISITFKLGVNMNAAVESVRSSLERIRGDLPRDAQAPVISKYSANDRPMMYISFFDTQRSALALSEYIDKFVVPSFETLDGVGQVFVYGKRHPAMRIWLDPARMAGANVTVEEISQLLSEQNASLPSGQIRSRDRYYSVVMDTSLKSIEQFNDLIIRDKQNQAIRLRDIGEAKLDAENVDSAFRINGKPGVALAIVPQSNANPLDVEKNIKRLFAEVKRTLPQGMHADIIYDQGDYIRASIHSVYKAFFEAVIFVWLVIFVFLRNFRATLIPITTIPVCLISAFSILYFLDFSINTISLMAFVLAIGLVVDDAIVMLENISRHIENGLTPMQAAIKGSREIVFSIIAMTLTLAAVYAPIAFTPGLLGILFREFTFTLAGAVIISGFVALTLSPMMCSRILTRKNVNAHQASQSHLLNYLQQNYSLVLAFVMQRRKWVFVSLAFSALIGMALYYFMPSELAPPEDMNVVYLSASAPRNASFQYMDTYAKQIEERYKNVPEISSYLSITGGGGSPSNSFQILLLKPVDERKRSSEEIVEMLTPDMNTISGVRVSVFTPSPPITEVVGDGSGDGSSVGFAIMTSSDYKKLQQTVARIMEILRAVPGFVRVDNSLKWDSEQFQLTINRDKAADLRVPISSITNTLSALIAGRNVGKTDEFNVLLQMYPLALANPNVFQYLYVRNDMGNMVPLTNMVSVKEITSPEVFRHFERLRGDSIHVSLAPNLVLSDAINILQNTLKQHLPDDMKFQFIGEAGSFIESHGKTLFTFALALVFIYLVLVAQFESFIDPFIILLTVPFAVVGAMLTLKLFGGSLNIYSNIGLITLIGLIAKHGILITDFANQLRSQNMSIHDAVTKAAMMRLRPILMTTAAMVLGAVPLAFSHGPGAECRQQIGMVIVGGLLFGTFFSLIVVPVMYTYLAPFRKISPQSTDQGTDYAPVL
jgi:multidrug efflux pump